MVKQIPSKRADYAAFATITTRWLDNDIYGHMNNALHYQLFDTAVNGHLVEQGVLNLKHGKTVFLVVETGCRYFSELTFPDVVTAGFRVAHLGNSSIRYEIALFRNDAQDAAAEGHFIHVNVDRETRRPVPVSDATREVLLALKRQP